MAEESNLPRIVGAGEGPVLRAFGDEIIVHLTSEQTGGKFSLWTNLTPPGGGPPPHYHRDEDELFLPQEGEVEFLSDGQWVRQSPGDVVFMPRGTVHAFRNVGSGTLRMLIQTTPGGFETFFARCAEVFAQPGPPEMQKLVEISTEHGIYFAEPEDA